MTVKEAIQYIFDHYEIECDIEIISITYHQPTRRLDTEARVIRKIKTPDFKE